METGKIDYKVVLDTSQMQAEANKVSQSFSNMASQAQSEGAKIDNAFSQAAANIGKAFAALGTAAVFEQLTKKIMDVRGEFQQLEVAFETMLGSMQQASTLMDQLVRTAATTPFGLQEVAGGAKQLLAYGVAAEDVNGTLIQLGDIAAGLSLRLSDLVYLYGTTMVQGRLYAQDMRQFMGRGIPLVDELAKQFGVTKDEVSDLVSKGKVGFPEVKKAIDNLTGAGSKFGGLMEKQSHTITGQISNIEDALDMMFNDIGKNSEGIINGILSGVSFVIEHYEVFGKILLTVVAAYGEYKAALMLVSAYKSMIASQEAAAMATKEAELAQLVQLTEAEMGKTAATEAGSIAETSSQTAIEAKVAALTQELQAEVNVAQAKLQSALADQQVATQMVANAQKRVSAVEAELVAAKASGDQQKINAVETELNAAKKNAATAAEMKFAASQQVSATQQAAATAQQKLSTFQTQADIIAKNANTAATGVWVAVTNAATAAWKALTAAMATNPLGMVLIAITTVISAISMFTGSNDEATNSVERFKQAVAGEENELQSYLMALQVLDKDSETYKQTLQKVVEIGEKHGRTLEVENGKIKDQTKAVQELTNAIRKEAAQKALAEQAAKSNEKAMESEKDAMEDLIEEAANASNRVRAGEHDVVKIPLEKIREITEATWSMISMDVMAHAQEIADAFAEGSEQGEAAIQAQVERIEQYLLKMKVSQEEIDIFHEKIVAYVTETAEGFSEAYGEMSRTEAQLQGLTGTTLELGDASVETDEKISDGLRHVQNEFGNLEGDIVGLTLAQDEVLNRIDGINKSTMEPQVKTDSIEFLRDMLYEIQGLLGDVTQGSLKSLRAQEKALKDQLESLTPDDPKVAPLRRQLQAIQRSIKTTSDAIYGTSGSGSGSGRGRRGSSGGHGSRPSRHRSGSSRRTEKPIDPKKVQYDIEQQEKTLEEYVADLKKDLWHDVTDGTIKAMKEGLDQELDEIKQGTQDELDALDDQINKLQEKKQQADFEIWKKNNPKKEDYEYEWPDMQSIDEFLTNYHEIGVLYRQRKAQIQKAGEEAAAKVRKDYADEEKHYLNEYLTQYGTYVEKRKAIAEQYAKDIAEALTIGEKMSLQRQMQEELQALDFEALKKDIHWDLLFEDLDRVSTLSLQKLKVQLEGALKSTTRDFNAEDMLAITEKIEEIDKKLIERQGQWKEAFGLVIPELEEQRRLIREAELAQERLNLAQEKQKQNAKEVEGLQKQITDYITGQGKSYSGNVSTANSQSIMAMFSGNDKATAHLSSLFGQLAQSEGKLANSTEVLGAAQGEAASASEAASAAGEGMGASLAITDKIIHSVNDNIQSAMELVEQLGLSDTKFGKGFASFAESSQYATEAWEALKSGNIMGVANGVVGSLRTLGDALGEWGIGLFGSSDKNLVRDIERLTLSNEALELAMSRLTKVMEEQAGSDLAKTYQQAVTDLETAMANTQEMLTRSGAAYNKGFFGIGGKHSTNSKIADLLSSKDFERIGQIVGKSVKSVADLWALSSEEMGKLAENAPDLWAKIKEGASKGYMDISEYLDAYVEYYDKLIELQKQYNESLTQTSYDELKSGLQELLNDTQTDAYDVIANVSDMMQKAILNIVLTKTMKPKLEKWYEQFAESMADDTLTAMESAALEQGYTDIYKQAKDEVDKAYRLAGIDPNRNDMDADASTGAWSALGEETGRSLDGRFAAIHIQVTKISEIMLLHFDTINRIDLRGAQEFSLFTEMQNLVYMSTTYLERIARNSDTLPSINSKLELIRQNTDRL